MRFHTFHVILLCLLIFNVNVRAQDRESTTDEPEARFITRFPFK